MHATSYSAMECLIQGLMTRTAQRQISVLDVGSMVAEEGQDSYRDIVERFANARYTGLDMAAGKNVDIVAAEPYKFPVESGAIDLVLSGQAFEHIEFPWLTIREIERVLKPGGSAIIIAPSSGHEHRYPQDCWRYYPDGMRALAKWAGLECIDAVTNWNETKRFMWGDTIGVFYKKQDGPEDHAPSLLRAEDLQPVLNIWAALLPPPPRPASSLKIMRQRIRQGLDKHILSRFNK